MPAMLEAAKLGSKGAKVGFDWPDPSGLFDKVREEIAELQAEIDARTRDTAATEAEMGDLLFTAVQPRAPSHLKIDPESALRGANAKFRRRFGAMEQAAGDAVHRSSSGVWTNSKRFGRGPSARRHRRRS